ncbi:MAG: SDR family oxidoreductase [Saprospiraceae bacterium]|nr:SDR family oxidoreductase [Saprospiraceae bacterium]MCB9320878.1 SDR family oxidoreductase [Lewinellaceae bacterium]
MQRFLQKTIVITGGGGVLGGHMAQAFAKEGAHVILIGRTLDSLEERQAMIQANGGKCSIYAADVLDKPSLIVVREEVLDQQGAIDVLINAAGGNLPGATVPPDKTIFDVSLEDFSRVTDINLMGTVIPSLVFGAAMASSGQGAILNISSMAVDRAITRVAGYSAAKAAMENFTRWMAVELALKFGEGLRVNALAPGFFIGNQNRALLTNPDGSYTERGQLIIQGTPMRRFGHADELNEAALFLCGPGARFITGIVLPVDGGFSAFSGV